MVRMMRIILLLMSVIISTAQVVTVRRAPRVPVSAEAPTYSFAENFEGTGYENAWTTNGPGLMDPDFATSPIEGAQMLQIDGLSQGPLTYTYSTISGAPSNHFFFKANFAVATSSNTKLTMSRIDVADDCTVLLMDAGTTLYAKLLHGSVGATNATPLVMTVGGAAVYSFWVQHHTGTGSDGKSWLWVAENSETKPGTPEAVITTGNSVNNPTAITIQASGSDRWHIDKIRMSTTQIGSNP